MPNTRSEVPRQFADLADRLRRQIVAGELAPGQKLPTFKALEADYGLATHTINRALQVLESEGRIVRKSGSGIYVAPKKRTLKGVIGFVGNSGTYERNHYWGPLMEGVEEFADREDQQLLRLKPWANANWDNVDGILVCFGTPEHVLRYHGRESVPIVSMLQPTPLCPYVSADDRGGMRDAVQALIARGHGRIAYLTPSGHFSAGFLNDSAAAAPSLAEQRLAGYADALRSAGVEPCADWVWETERCDAPVMDMVAFGEQAMLRWLDHGFTSLGCTAICGHNDGMAIGIMRALASRGTKVPGDVSVMGFDSTEVCELVTPRLSSVEVPLKEIGRRSAALLLQIARGMPAQSVVLPTHVQMRDSTTALAR